MSKKLNEIVDKLLSTNTEATEALKKAHDVDKNGLTIGEILGAAKETIIREIYDEIKEEVCEDAILAAEIKMNEKVKIKQIKEMNALAITGLLLALIVGILVNQVTEIIMFLKGSLENGGLIPTIIIAILFLVAALIITFGLIIRNILDILQKGKKS
ncbi:hypothetical protein [Anaerotignum sp. MB30-C6]|uniref:hypothetical protein n=1 Tax=Anaerotignum sp. MB30-C6 TaxID=3070814 RepID=UPI0027DD1BB8|nr:hypothetical protein [Anaerotignum sp. MB30-C6]WMI80885.1 hypothetical protein RBQ60_13860 [Anaerotignum sp. MB30-C6]WMI81860.1 hypothetical protein RBQ60_03785 [Anaerotignum sp. MB30-C6]WMI81960.1 hypothetical protein RBQ60_04300 [Anaerotignum sp. MB30-C6]